MKTIEELNLALYSASKNNNLEMVIYLVKKGAITLNQALVNASYSNNLEIVKYLVKKGAKDLNVSLSYASKKNNLEIANFLKFVIDISKNNKQNTLLIF